MTGDTSDDFGDLIRNLLRSIPPEALADPGTFGDEFRPLRPTAVGKSRFKQNAADIDRALIDEHKARATARSKPTHAEPGTRLRPGRKRRTAGRPSQVKAPPDGLNLVQAFSIAGAKARKRREKFEKFGPGEARGIHRRRVKKQKVRTAIASRLRQDVS